MFYSDFTLRKIRQDLGITIHEGGRFLPDIPFVPADDLLRQGLAEGLPIVLARGSEKARSEWIIWALEGGYDRLQPIDRDSLALV